MRTWLIYCAERVETGQVYVGQTHRGFDRRQQEHLTQSARGKLKRFHAALRVHGPEQFTWRVLTDRIDNQDEADRLEAEWIITLNAHVSQGGYNLTFGGHGSRGYKHSERARKKIGDRFRGKPKSEEQRRKMGASISRARKGKKYGPRQFKNPDQAHENLSAWQRGLIRERGWNHSEETKDKMRKPHKCGICGEMGHKRTTCKRNNATASD